MFKIFMLLTITILFSNCGSHPVLAEKSDIKVSRETPDSDCKSLGPIEGRSIKINATNEEALDDLKAEAVRKGSNYVKVETFGAHGGSIRGEAYFCE